MSLLRPELEQLASQNGHLRGTLITPQGWDLYFDYAQSDDTYATIDPFWTDNAVGLIAELRQGDIVAGQDQDLDEVSKLWDKVTALRSPRHPDAQTPESLLEVPYAEAGIHTDLLLGDLHMTSRYIRGKFLYMLCPPVTENRSLWNAPFKAKQWLVGPDIEKPTTAEITSTLLTILAGNALVATDFQSGEQRPATIPHIAMSGVRSYRQLWMHHM